MRRYYPGHRSYSLGRLCTLYEIDLEEHHRALCDAEAAAKLLNLINRKRTSVAGQPREPLNSTLGWRGEGRP